MTESIDSKPIRGRDLPGGKNSTYGKRRANHPTPPAMDSIWSLDSGQAPVAEKPEASTQTQPLSEAEQPKDPALLDLPTGVAISTGPYTQDGIYTIGAPEGSSFRLNLLSAPRVEGRYVSRDGTLFIKGEDGQLQEPPPQYKMFHWITTEKGRLLPAHFRGANSAPNIPNFDKEKFVFE